MKLLDALIYFLQADRVCIPHRPAAIGREAVAVEINDVNIHGAQGIAFFQDACSFIHQRVDAAIHNFLGVNLALRNACLGCPLADQFLYLRVRNRAPLSIVFVPAGAGLLSVAPHLA